MLCYVDCGYNFHFFVVLNFSHYFQFLVIFFFGQNFNFHLFFAVGHSQNFYVFFLPGFSIFSCFYFCHSFQFSVVLHALCDFSNSSPLFSIRIFVYFLFLSCQGFAIFYISFPFCSFLQVFALSSFSFPSL